MKLRILIACAFTALLFNANATVHNISVGSNFFNPSTLTITVGDTVVWTNTSGNHNVNGTTATFSTNPASFGNSVGPAGWVYQYTFTLPGTYDYQCDPHAPGMSGSITVNAGTPTADLLISGVYDGPLPGGNPKGVELYVVNNIANLSLYGLGSANNGGGTDGQEFTFPAVSATAGDYIYVTTDTADFRSFFGFGAEYQSGAMAINGDDAIELFSNGAVADVFGDINVDGSGTPWDYLDSWAYRVNGTGPDGTTFVLGNWTFGGVDVYDPVTTNAAANPAMAIGTYSTVATVSSDLILTGVVDGPLSGGLPKAVELYASAPIADLSAYGVSRASGGNGGIGAAAYVMPADAAVQGQFIYITNDSAGFYDFFGFDADYVDSSTAFNGVQGNGDDAYELYKNNTVVDVMGDVSVDGTGEPWEYLDSWAYRVDNTGPDGSTFVLANWTFGSPNALDNETSNATATTPFPIGTYNSGGSVGAGGIPNYSIADLTSSAVDGVADSLNVEARIHGVIYTDDFDGNAGYSFYMYDNTGGINVFNFNDVGTFAVTRGDSVRVIGSIDQFNGLTEMVIDSVVVLSTGNSLKTPAVVTTLDETTEGEYIRMNGMSLVTPSQWPTTATTSSGVDVDITDGTNTFILRIDRDTDLNGTPAPTGLFDVIGAGGQFDGSNPYTSGYQIQPRDLQDIIPAVAATPTINFPGAAQAVLEDAGTVTISLPVAPTSMGAETIQIYVSNGAGITATDYTTSPAAVTDTISLIVPANASSVSFDLTVVDDMLQESDEDITLTLVNPSAGLTIGSINTHVFTIEDNDTPIPTYDIAQIDGTNALGEMDSSGVYCKIIATVTSPQLSATRTDFFITNATNTAGIKINQSGLIAYNAVVGDEVRVVGTLSQFRGGIQISADSLTVLASGNPILPTVQPATAGMGEPEEGRVLRYNGVELVDTTGWPSANFGNFDIVLANGDTAILRLDSDIPTLWGPAPVGKFDVIGVSGQYSSSSSAPFLDGYQIQPRVSTEIIVVLPKLAITEVMPSSNLSGAIGGDWFELTNYGTTPINLNGFSWDDNSRTPGTHSIASAVTLMINAGQSIIFYDGIHPEDSAWAYEWSQAANNIVVIGADDFGPIGFSGLSSSGDEVNFYDDKGQLVSRATYTGGDISAGVSVEYDTAGVKLGASSVGVRGAYASLGGDIGSPGNMMPVSISELLLNNMSIYPNPATELLQISSGTNAPKAFTLLDLAGNRIMHVESTQETVGLNVADLPAGVYILQVNVDGQRAARKVIVQ